MADVDQRGQCCVAKRPTSGRCGVRSVRPWLCQELDRIEELVRESAIDGLPDLGPGGAQCDRIDLVDLLGDVPLCG